MNQSFSKLLEGQDDIFGLKAGQLVFATVSDIQGEYLSLNAGLKSDALVSMNEFVDRDGEFDLNIGDQVEVFLECIEDGHGETVMSRDKAKKIRAWKEIEDSFNSKQSVSGKIVEKVRAGFKVDLGVFRAFLPRVMADFHDDEEMIGREMDFKIMKLIPNATNIASSNVILSRKMIEHEGNKEELLENLKEGDIIDGIVRHINQKHGIFIDLGGIDGLLRHRDVSWNWRKAPAEKLFEVGQKIKIMVIKFDKENNTIALGYKQISEESPWRGASRQYGVGTRHFGNVIELKSSGVIVELEDGIEGFVHYSEVDWTNKGVNPKKHFQIGEETEVMVLDIDETKERLSLGIKQCHENPWDNFAANHQVGDKFKGAVNSVTEFGLFVGLEGGMDGLIHISDLSWDEPAEELIKKYQKGDEIEALILNIDSKRERVALGVKQLDGDPYADYLQVRKIGERVQGKVVKITEYGVKLKLADKVLGSIRNLNEEQKANLQLDQELTVKIVGVGRDLNLELV